MWAGVLPVLLPARDGRGLLTSKEDRVKVVAHFVVLISAVFRVIEAKLAGEVLAEALDITVGEQDTPGYIKDKRRSFVRRAAQSINQSDATSGHGSLSDVHSNGVINQPIKSKRAVLHLALSCVIPDLVLPYRTLAPLQKQRYARSYEL